MAREWGILSVVRLKSSCCFICREMLIWRKTEWKSSMTWQLIFTFFTRHGNLTLFNICLVKGFVKWWFAWIRPLLCLNWQIWDTLSRLSWLLLCDQAIISENSEYISLSLVLNPVLFDMGFLFHSTCICTSVMTLAFNCSRLLKHTLSTKTDKREFF